jgi:hypothetical protein
LRLLRRERLLLPDELLHRSLLLPVALWSGSSLPRPERLRRDLLRRQLL